MQCRLGKRSPGFLFIELTIAILVMTLLSGIIAHYAGMIARWNREIALRYEILTTLQGLFGRITYNLEKSDKQQQQSWGTLAWKTYHTPVDVRLPFGIQQPLETFVFIEGRGTWHDWRGNPHELTLITGVCR
jgi:hypothetical protein